MRIEYRYNHLHAEEYLYYRKKTLIEEIEKSINDIDANKYLKISCDKSHLGEIYYDQKALNDEIKERLNASGWNELKISYFVTDDEKTSKQIVKISEKEEQKKVIEDNGFEALPSHNQVDFFKDRVAVEVQFGKYFSVAYDLHVKHTFFYLRDDIDVGIEIIPTHKMMLCMDTGVAWFENEVTNVIREGRNNPAVPVYILGIESDDAISTNPQDYIDKELIEIIRHSDKTKLVGQITKIKKIDEEKWSVQIHKAEEKVKKLNDEIEELNKYYLKAKDSRSLTSKTEKAIIKKSEKLIEKRDAASDSCYDIKENPPLRLQRIYRIEQVL